MKAIHQHVHCTNTTVKNILGIIGAQTSEVLLHSVSAVTLIPRYRWRSPDWADSSKFLKYESVVTPQYCFPCLQVSYLSTATGLSDKEKFPYFFRCLPPP